MDILPKPSDDEDDEDDEGGLASISCSLRSSAVLSLKASIRKAFLWGSLKIDPAAEQTLSTSMSSELMADDEG